MAGPGSGTPFWPTPCMRTSPIRPGPAHGALAQLLRTRARPRAKGSRTAQAAEIARHLRAAGQDEQAVNYLVMAAQGARNVAAMAEAASFLTEALQIEPDDPDLLIELAEVSAFRGLPAIPARPSAGPWS